MKSWREQLLLRVALWWVRSLRVHWEGVPPEPGSIIALWHQDLPACLAAFRQQDICVMISQSRDGDRFSHLATRLGYTVFRGSSSKGQGSVRHLLRALRQGFSVGMALDGPRGPALQEKHGTAWLGKQAPATIAHIHVRYTRAFRLNSWDKTFIPWPGTSLYLSCGGRGYAVPRGGRNPERLCQESPPT